MTEFVKTMDMAAIDRVITLIEHTKSANFSKGELAPELYARTRDHTGAGTEPMTEEIVAEPQSETITMPERPEAMVTALREGVEYVDATKLIRELLGHVERLHQFASLIGESLVVTQRSVIREHKKLIEIEADMTAAGIGSSGDRSALILPERMRTGKT